MRDSAIARIRSSLMRPCSIVSHPSSWKAGLGILEQKLCLLVLKIPDGLQ